MKTRSLFHETRVSVISPYNLTAIKINIDIRFIKRGLVMCIEFSFKRAGIPIVRNFLHQAEGVVG